MRKSRFTDKQIIGFIKQADAGKPRSKVPTKEQLGDITDAEFKAV